MKEIISQRTTNSSPERQVQTLEKQIWTEGVRLLAGRRIQLLSSSDPRYIQMFVLGKEFLEGHSVNNVDLAICGILNNYNVVEKDGEEVPVFEDIELYTFHEGYGVIKNCYSSEEEDMTRLNEEGLKELLKIAKESRIIENKAEEDISRCLPRELMN